MAGPRSGLVLEAETSGGPDGVAGSGWPWDAWPKAGVPELGLERQPGGRKRDYYPSEQIIAPATSSFVRGAVPSTSWGSICLWVGVLMAESNNTFMEQSPCVRFFFKHLVRVNSQVHTVFCTVLCIVSTLTHTAPQQPYGGREWSLSVSLLLLSPHSHRHEQILSTEPSQLIGIPFLLHSIHPGPVYP